MTVSAPPQPLADGNTTDAITLMSRYSEQIFHFVLTIVVLTVFRMITYRLINHQIKDSKRRYLAQKIATYFTLAIFLGAQLVIWPSSGDSVLRFLGLFSAGVAIAMHETISNFAAWLFIITRRPLDIGDRIEVNGRIGDIVDISMLNFSMLEVGGDRIGAEQSTGRLIHMPNAFIWRHAVTNYNQEFNYIWTELQVLVTFESDWRAAKTLLQEMLDQHSLQFTEGASRELAKAARKLYLKSGTLTPIVYTSVEASGVRLSMRMIIPPRRRRGIEAGLWESILDTFNAHPDIELAYPTTRFYQTNESQNPSA